MSVERYRLWVKFIFWCQAAAFAAYLTWRFWE